METLSYLTSIAITHVVTFWLDRFPMETFRLVSVGVILFFGNFNCNGNHLSSFSPCSFSTPLDLLGPISLPGGPYETSLRFCQASSLPRIPHLIFEKLPLRKCNWPSIHSLYPATLFQQASCLWASSGVSLTPPTEGDTGQALQLVLLKPISAGLKRGESPFLLNPNAWREHLSRRLRAHSQLSWKEGSFLNPNHVTASRQIMARGQNLIMAAISGLEFHFGLGLSWLLMFTDISQSLEPQSKLKHSESHFNIPVHASWFMSEFSGSASTCKWKVLGGGISYPILGIFPKSSLSRNKEDLGHSGSRNEKHLPSTGLFLQMHFPVFGRISVTSDGTSS